jgi:hypothetical protein
MLLLRPNSAVNVLDVKDARRGLFEVLGVELFSSDILYSVVWLSDDAALQNSSLNKA